MNLPSAYEMICRIPHIGLIYVNLWKSLTYMCLSKCLRLQKNLGLRILIGSNIVLNPFPCGEAFLHIFYNGIYWKTAKIAYFRVYEPLIVVLVLVSYLSPKGQILETFLSKFWERQIFGPLDMGALKGVKIVIFGVFLAKINCLRPILASTNNLWANFLNHTMGVVP